MIQKASASRPYFCRLHLMDFARVAAEGLHQIDFVLPPEPGANESILNGNRVANPRVYIGCPRWGVKEWVGTVYPKGTKDAQFLSYYIRQFNCIELNSTFYNLYSPSAIGNWADKATGQDFKFCPKVFQGISHDGAINNKLELTTAFMDSMMAFGEHLGPCFLQLSEGFGPARKQELFDWVAALPADFDLFVELRHPAWFQENELDSVVAILADNNKGLLLTDVAGRRDVCHMRLSQPRTFIRFVSNAGHPTDFARMDAWAKQLSKWIQQGMEEVYFMVHSPDEAKAPELVTYFTDALNKEAGLSLPAPQIQKDLFG